MAKKYKRNVSKSQSAATKAVVEKVVPTNVESKSQASVASSNRFGANFNPDYAPVRKDLTRIAIMAGAFFVILIVLSFFLR